MEVPPTTDPDDKLMPTTASFSIQLLYVSLKNVRIIRRSPIKLFAMAVSSVASVLLTWAAAPDKFTEDDFPPLTSCGIVDPISIVKNNSSIWDTPVSLNDAWNNSFPVGVMSLGPVIYAIFCYSFIHSEIASKMLGVLRGLGMEESVFILSWWIPLVIIAALNSILATITSQLVPLHAFNAIYFGGVFNSFLCINLALLSCSILLAALTGTIGKAPHLCNITMLVAPWVLVIIILSSSPYKPLYDEELRTPSGLMWMYADTTTISAYRDYFCSDDPYVGYKCEKSISVDAKISPIVSLEFGKKSLPLDVREGQITKDDYFEGCYTIAPFSADSWSTGGSFGRVAWFMYPYYHYFNIWGNFAGFTRLPNKVFRSTEAALPVEELALKAYPVDPRNNATKAAGSSLFEQGSFIRVEYYYDKWEYTSESLSNCPVLDPISDDEYSYIYYNTFCPFDAGSSPTTGPSVNSSLGYLLALSAIYIVIASYWLQVFPMGNGAARKWYFACLPRYWLTPAATLLTHDQVEEGDSYTRGVEVKDATKSFGSVHALKGVSFSLARGEVTALLGHNGAGKTTLSKIISCDHAISDGQVKVFGWSVEENRDTVRKFLGVCQQDDYLWSNLTAREHLELFAVIRGMERSQIHKTVQTWLESVDLADVQSNYSMSFSGGMKRRLSLALATIGHRQLIILDEPTTGMDPVSRRFVWKHIDSIKTNRVVLLTTHAMEEADLLADKVAIMKNGEVAALGTPLELKAKYGSALSFSISVDPADVTVTKSNILKWFQTTNKWISLDCSTTGSITLTIEKVSHEASIEGIGVSQLADFVAWLENDESHVSEYGFSNSTLEEVFLKVTGEQGTSRSTCSEHCGPNDVCTNVPDDEETVSWEGVSFFKPNLNILSQTRALVSHFLVSGWAGGRGSLLSYIFVLIFFLLTFLVGLAIRNYFFLWMIIPTVCISLFPILAVAMIYSDRAQGLLHLMKTQGLLRNSYLLSICLYSFFTQLLYGAIVLSLFFSSPMFRDPMLCEVKYDSYSDYNYYNVDEELPYEATLGLPDCTYDYDDYAYGTRPQKKINIHFDSLEMFEDESDNNVKVYAFASSEGYAKIFLVSFIFALTTPGTVLVSSFLPGNRITVTVIAFFILLSSLSPVLWIISFFTQKQDNFDESYIKCMNNIVGPGICNTTFTEGNQTDNFLNCVGLELIDEYSLCAPSYLSMNPQFGVFQTMAALVQSDISFLSVPPSYIEDIFIPRMEGVTCIGNKCELPFLKTFFWNSIGFMVLGATILFFVGLLVANISAFQNGWILQIKLKVTRVLRCTRGNSYENVEEEIPEELQEVMEERAVVDSAIQTMRDVCPQHSGFPPILTHKLRKVYPAIGGAPPKVALGSFNLHVPKGQVLALLGKNGAGKTTALKIMNTAHESSGGTAMIAGYNVASDRLAVFERLGNCPQFDVIWKNLSVRHHIEFFARLKGLPRENVNIASHAIANAVGLGSKDVYKRQAGALSGGMRRRLTMAMSLIGSPNVVLMDEPSTGLDPSTRHKIWDLVKSFATQERAMIITTHMMIEADILCDRIAIMSRGRLKVIATQQYLKDKFGSGYLLQINLTTSTSENMQKALDFATNRLHPEALLINKQAKTISIQMPKNVDLVRVFSALYSPEAIAEGCINQFLLSQASLEDVFIALDDS